MQLFINQAAYEVADQPERPLVWVLRDELGLTGTKFGCGIGECGTCTVLVDGQPTKSCQTPVSSVQGKQITTIEGLAVDGQLHPVQQAFIDEQTPQCGWCMSAQILTAAALLEANPNPSDDEIRAGMDRVYCRCGTYPRIRKSVRRAAAELAAAKQGKPA
jgi:isoquinoline 1-oxidoreductase subunit alpha